MQNIYLKCFDIVQQILHVGMIIFLLPWVNDYVLPPLDLILVQIHLVYYILTHHHMPKLILILLILVIVFLLIKDQGYLRIQVRCLTFLFLLRSTWWWKPWGSSGTEIRFSQLTQTILGIPNSILRSSLSLPGCDLHGLQSLHSGRIQLVVLHHPKLLGTLPQIQWPINILIIILLDEVRKQISLQ